MKYQGKITDPKDLVTKEYVDTGLSGKQNTLTFDDAPTAGSSNPVKSSGIKSALTQVETDLAGIHATGATNATGAAIAKDTYFYLNDVLVQAIADIDNGDAFASGTNYKTITAGALNNLPKIKSKEYTVTFSPNQYVQPFDRVAEIFYDAYINRENVIKISTSVTTNFNATFWNDRICISCKANVTNVTFLVYYFG